MKLVKNYNFIVISVILLISIYLWTVFININCNPNYDLKGHHYYQFNGYLIFVFYCLGWIVFMIGVIQLKYHLMGINRLPFISIINFGIIGYVLFILFVCGDFEMQIIKTGMFRKALSIVLPSIILLFFSWSKYVKEIHEKSKKKINLNQ